MDNTFELGPIRPPSEAFSVLIRVTRNCPWNRCRFCHTYKDTRFSRRSVEEVKADIDAIHTIAGRILQTARQYGDDILITEDVLNEAANGDQASPFYYRQVAFWLQYGMKSVFLQDANSLIIKTDQLVEILEHIKSRFPSVERITTYARGQTISKKSFEEMKELRNAGLSRLHIGMESGSDTVLDIIQKGVTPQQLIDAGKKAVDAGFDVSFYYMPGIGGKQHMKENAIESAKVISAVNPTFIRIRSTVPLPGTPLYRMMEEEEWTPLTEEEKVAELRLFIENCQGITSQLLSDHMMNLVEDIEGTFPDDKDTMLGIIDSFFAMKQEDREKFIIGRRAGRYRFLSGFSKDPQVDSLYKTVKSRYNSIDEAVLEILKNYI